VAQVTVIKTLPHLVPLHIKEKGAEAHASTYSPQIVKFLIELKAYKQKSITYTSLLAVIQRTYTRVKKVTEIGEYAVTGDIVSIWPVGYLEPVRIEFFGEEVEKMYRYHVILGQKLESVEKIYLSTYKISDRAEIKAITVDNNGNKGGHYIFTPYLSNILEDEEIKTVETDYTYPSLYWQRLDLFKKEIERLVELKYQVKIITKHWEDLEAQGIWDLLSNITNELLQLADNSLPAGVISEKKKIAIFTDREIFGTLYVGHDSGLSSNTNILLEKLAGEISIGDYVVHEDYGVARYAGLTQEEVDGAMLEYLELHYADQAIILVPIGQVHKLTRYIGEEGITPILSSLQKGEWQKLKTKATKAITTAAKELLEHYARRELSKSRGIGEIDTKGYLDFVSKFQYTETKDQLQSVQEVLVDMQSEKPMNRLLIGDVGFGKTEVILRASFKMAEAGGMVAILAPTTVLAAQHLAVFKERFKDTPYKVISLSRFNTNKENRDLVDLINNGDAHIIIGTHRLLSRDVRFRNLGLLVVDEEQRFGVAQKERIKTLNYGVHHLATSATPIPRTLGMALSSIQDISIMTTPPKGRLPIQTELIKDDWNIIATAIHKEIERGGQIYFVHNRVQTLRSAEAKLQSLLPGVRILTAHGQMPPQELDKVMTSFYDHHADVLLCTTIIENGLDLPNVNTIIVDRAHTLGLAQLYQLRGRVGRSDKKAYCYLFYEGKTLKDAYIGVDEKTDGKSNTVKNKIEVAKYIERLKGLVDATELGAGFQVASRDLELRGAGNILGQEQHGHISRLGYALYMKLLGSEIEKLKQVADSRIEYLTI